MVGLLAHLGAARREHLGGASVRGQAPAAAHGVVDGAAHERVAERKAARHLGRAHEVGVQQVVERVERLLGRDVPHRRRHVGLERLTGHGRRLEQAARAVGQRGQLLGDRARHRGGHAVVAAGVVARGAQHAPVGGAAELLEVERVAAAVAVDGGHRRVIEPAEQLPGLALVELRQLEARDARAGQRSGQPLRRRPGAKAQRQQHGPGRPAARQGGDQLQ